MSSHRSPSIIAFLRQLVSAEVYCLFLYFWFCWLLVIFLWFIFLSIGYIFQQYWKNIFAIYNYADLGFAYRTSSSIISHSFHPFSPNFVLFMFPIDFFDACWLLLKVDVDLYAIIRNPFMYPMYWFIVGRYLGYWLFYRCILPAKCTGTIYRYPSYRYHVIAWENDGIAREILGTECARNFMDCARILG